MQLKKHIAKAVRNIQTTYKEHTQTITTSVNAQFAPTGTLDRSTYWTILVAMTVFFLMFSINAHADTDGATLWAQFKGLFFGPYGLIIGGVMLAIAIFGFLRQGFGWASMIFGMTAVFFLIPGVVKGLQSYASTVAS